VGAKNLPPLFADSTSFVIVKIKKRFFKIGLEQTYFPRTPTDILQYLDKKKVSKTCWNQLLKSHNIVRRNIREPNFYLKIHTIKK
jgi:hypothetical protein